MSVGWLTELAWKSVLLAALFLLILALANRRSAAEKSLIGDCGLLSLLLLPVTIRWLPPFELAAPQFVESAVERIAPTAYAVAAPAASAASAGAAGAFDWNALALALYLLPAAAGIAGLAFSLLRLRQLYARSSVLEDGSWLTALASAQNRVGLKHGTALLISDEINSPISWGVVRPVIMIDPNARSASERAEAIITHELAHVHRLDWLKLIVARVVVALFWFNPLVWVLARRCHQLREEAADDAVLRTPVTKSDYAELLVTAVRHSNSRSMLAVNGVAPSKSSITQRVNHVLDGARPRQAAALKWSAGLVAIALVTNAALAVTQPVLEHNWGTDPNAGERAAAALSAIPDPHARTLARAILMHDWNARKIEGDTNFNAPRAVQPLVRALRDDDPRVRRIALWGLSEMRPAPEYITPSVSRLLSDPYPEVRAQAARTIGDFESVRNSRSIEKLLLNDPSPAVRLQAAHALGDIQDPASATSLQLALSDPDPAVRRKAGWALKQVAEAQKILNR
jgi:beta-lactamase regulating signal transducer with metallopeptidase domain